MQNQIYPTAATIVHKTLNDLATVCKVCTVHSNTGWGKYFQNISSDCQTRKCYVGRSMAQTPSFQQPLCLTVACQSIFFLGYSGQAVSTDQLIGGNGDAG